MVRAVRDGPGQAAEFRHNQGVALAHGGQGLVETGSGAGSAGEALVGVDAVFGDAKLQEGRALRAQVLAVGGTASISDEGCGHGGSVRIRRIRKCFRTIHMRCFWRRTDGARSDGLGRTLDVPLTDNAAPGGVNG